MRVLRDALNGLAEESTEGNSDGGVCLVKRDERDGSAHKDAPRGHCFTLTVRAEEGEEQRYPEC